MSMRKLIALLTALCLAVCCLGGALADQKVQLPESRYSLTLPDGMTYDGPGESPDDARFAYVSASLGLDIQFFCQDNEKGATLEGMATVLREDDGFDAAIYRIGGIDMIVFEIADPQDPPEKGMKCMTYMLEDHGKVQMICFWYAGQEAANRTADIIASITDKD